MKHETSHIPINTSHEIPLILSLTTTKKESIVREIQEVILGDEIGWEFTVKGYKEIFWGDEIVLYLDLGDGYMDVYNHQSSYTELLDL